MTVFWFYSHYDQFTSSNVMSAVISTHIMSYSLLLMSCLHLFILARRVRRSCAISSQSPIAVALTQASELSEGEEVDEESAESILGLADDDLLGEDSVLGGGEDGEATTNFTLDEEGEEEEEEEEVCSKRGRGRKTLSGWG